MPLSGLSLLAFPIVPGEQYEVYAVLVTLLLSFVILVLLGSYWQK